MKWFVFISFLFAVPSVFAAALKQQVICEAHCFSARVFTLDSGHKQTVVTEGRVNAVGDLPGPTFLRAKAQCNEFGRVFAHRLYTSPSMVRQFPPSAGVDFSGIYFDKLDGFVRASEAKDCYPFVPEFERRTGIFRRNKSRAELGLDDGTAGEVIEHDVTSEDAGA